MTIHIPKELESTIEAAVHGGHFASLDDAMAEAARLLIRDLKQRPQPPAEDTDSGPDPIMGLWSDCTDEIDQIVTDAYHQRQQPSWRKLDLE